MEDRTKYLGVSDMVGYALQDENRRCNRHEAVLAISMVDMQEMKL